MKNSLVIQSAIDALRDAKERPSLQPTLAAMRTMQGTLFDDLQRTLSNIYEAPDRTVYGRDKGKSFTFQASTLKEWINSSPNGIAFPITVAATVENGQIVAPMRLLIMVPVRSKQHLTVPRGLCALLGAKIWGDRVEYAQGEHAALLLGMYAHTDGQWEFGPVVGWAAAVPGESGVPMHGLMVLPELVAMKAKADGKTVDDTINKLLLDYIMDEIGFLVS